MTGEWTNHIYVKAILLGVGSATLLGVLVGPLETLFLFGPTLVGTALHVWSLALGSVAIGIGAFVASWKSPSAQFLNVWIYWAAAQIAGTISMMFTTLPMWYNVVGIMSVAVASLAGWYIERLSRTGA